MDFN
jgi:hypothetical protein